MIAETSTTVAPAGRAGGLGWHDLADELNELGCALTEPVLMPAECAEIAALYSDDDLFRATAPWPDDFSAWLGQCHAAGQQRPTPLLLSYGPGDWNALHQDLYGELYFPLQVVIGLDAPGTDYAGGEFLLVEQRPRAQSRGTVSTLGQGQALIFTTSERPVPSRRGWSASPVRHGVSVVRSGKRRTLGLVLHDAR